MMRHLLCVTLSYAIALAPFAALPARSFAQQVAQQDDGESLTSKLLNLSVDIDVLLDRAFYPHVPRAGATGMPSASDAQQLDLRLKKVRDEIQAQMPARLSAISDPEDETLPAEEIAKYFAAAQRLESLKIVMGLRVDPARWQDDFGLNFPLENLGLMKFFETVSFASSTDVEILGIKNPQQMSMLAELNFINDKPAVQFKINPSFVEPAELQRFAGQMNTRGALLFASHFAAHRLYEGLAATLYLGEGEGTLPEPSDNWKQRFASFKVKRDMIRQSEKNQVLAVKKPLLFEALLKSLGGLQKQNSGVILNAEFWQEYQKLSGVETAATLDLEKVKLDENKAFRAALMAVIRSWPLENLKEDLDSAVNFAKRLSLRYLVVNNKALGGTLQPVSRAALKIWTDRLANEFTAKLMQSPELANDLAKMEKEDAFQIRKAQKNAFQDFLTKTSEKIRDFFKSEINLQYLIESKRNEINALKLSPLIKAVTENLEMQANYRIGYLEYRKSLLTILQGYTTPPMKTVTLTALYNHKSAIKFSPNNFNDVLPQEYIKALAQDSAGRTKDISDLLDLGRLLKFDVYESLPYQEGVKRATPETLKLSDSMLGALFGSEKRNYLEAVKKDLYTSAPILGTGGLWEALASGQYTREQARGLIDKELQAAHAQARQNLGKLDKHLRKIESGDENSLKDVSEQLRTLVTRASQMSMILSSFSSFSGYYDEIRKELLTPNFWEKQWEQFNGWATTATWVLIGFYIVTLTAHYSVSAGRAVDLVSSALAPVFGPNLSRLSPVIWGLLGINAATAGAKGLVTEANRVKTLQRFFQCNANGPCVSLHADVVRQAEVRDASRLEFAIYLAIPILVVGGFLVINAFSTKLIQGLSGRVATQLEADLKVLNLREGTALNEQALETAAITAQRAAKTAAPGAAGELSAVYVEQAQLRVQHLIWEHGKKWKKFDERLRQHADKLGLSMRTMKNPQILANTLKSVEAHYANGQLSAMEYLEFKNSIFTIQQTYAPIWMQMEGNRTLRAFYDSVWDASSGISGAQVNANFTYFGDQLRREFTTKMDEFYGANTSRVEGLAQNLLRELERNPSQSQKRVEELRRLLKRENP